MPLQQQYEEKQGGGDDSSYGEAYRTHWITFDRETFIDLCMHSIELDNMK